MGKRTKLREAQRGATAELLAARLRARSPAKPRIPFLERYGDFTPDLRAKIEAYRSLALRAPESWRCALRSRSPERRFLELVRYTFTDYPVAAHLERAWLGAAPEADRDIYGEPAPDFCRWYIAVGQGRSLFKEGAQAYMSRHETHHFVTSAGEVDSTQRAFWYAFARAQQAGSEVALRVARSKLATLPVVDPFCKEVARFFAMSPTSILEMNDLIDFLRAAKQEDASFTLNGRTLAGLRRRIAEWHRELHDIACDGRWPGRRQQDATYVSEEGSAHVVWRFRQIKTGEELAREGRRLSHCVASYKDLCVSGRVSIWSVSCEHAGGEIDHRLTIEFESDGSISQCRGFANREPTVEETAMVRRWAEEFGLRW
ncbi:MAG: PcfJ domain-containing protein [Xanthobacteraceae bacterium]